MIRLIDVKKVYDNGTEALKGISFTIEDGDFVFLVGPSGSGKSTIIKLLTGEIVPTAGRVMVNGFSMGRISDKQIPYMRRTIGVIFQDFRLITGKTVRENLSLAMCAVGAGPREIKNRIPYVLELVGLKGKEGSFPDQLSGGEQQRVAIARALVMGQEILLLDEPLSNLDAKLRVEVRTELRQIQQKFGITTMYVTHDQDEALSMSDIIAVMRRGRIEQIGSPWEIYFRPATRFVADFVGTVNFLEGTAHREADGSLSVDHRGMRLRVDEDTDLQGGEPVTLVVRPEGISLMGLEETVPEGTALRGTIENYSFLGRMIRYWVRVGEEVFVIDDANVDLTGARTGDVQLRLDTRKLHVLKGGGADAAG